MAVKAGASVSRRFSLSSGVPQGSVLGPVLFNVYMADLAQLLEVNGVAFHIYADDVILYAAFGEDTVETVFHSLQQALLIVEAWMWENQLLLSSSKTSAHLFHNLRSRLPICPDLFLSGSKLSLSNSPLKWLGVEFDLNLKMDLFIRNSCRSAYNQLRMIRYIRPALDKATSLMLCNALVLSRLDYCSSLVVAVCDREMKKIQKVLNLTARTVTQSNRLDHITPILRELGWLPARKRHQLKIVKMVHLSLCGKTAAYLSCIVHIPGRPVRSSVSGMVSLEVAQNRRKPGEGAWEVVAPRIWNALPSSLRVQNKFSLRSVIEHMSI
jgi:hypothetical protein